MTVKMNIFSLIFRLVFLRKISHSRSHEQMLIFLFIFIDTVTGFHCFHAGHSTFITCES